MQKLSKLVSVFAALSVICTLSLPSAAHAAKKKTASKNPVLKISTSLGDMKVELDQEKAPISVKNFLDYVKAKHYDGTVFHRVIPGFMIQGGGMDKKLEPKPGAKAPIKNEAGNGLQNLTGTLAMARTSIVDSATDQFFINVVDNAFLDHRDDSPQGYGYAVFGKVTDGMDVVHKIEKVQTTTQGQYENVPSDPVVIKSIRVSK